MRIIPNDQVEKTLIPPDTERRYERRRQRSPVLPREVGPVLCAQCSFENPVSEGWLVVSDGSERTIVCPECGHVADHRTERSAPAPRAD